MRPTAPKLNPVRRILWAYAISHYGNWFFRTGIIYEAYTSSRGSTAVLTLAIAVVYCPILVGSRLLTPLVDGVEIRRLLIALDLVRTAALGVLLLVVTIGPGLTNLASLLTLAALSLVTPVFASAQVAFLRRTLHEEAIQPALSKIARIDWLTFVLGTTTGPLLLEISTIRELIVLDSITFLISAAFLVGLAVAPPGGGQSPGGLWERRLPLGQQTRLLLWSVWLLNVGAGLINVYPFVVVQEFLQAGPYELGAINLGNGIGGIIGSTLVARFGGRRVGPSIAFGAGAVAVSLFAMTMTGNLVMALLASSSMLLSGQIFAVSIQSKMLSNEPVDRAALTSGRFMLATFTGTMTSVLIFLAATSTWATTSTFHGLLVGGALLSAASLVIVIKALGWNVNGRVSGGWTAGSGALDRLQRIGKE